VGPCKDKRGVDLISDALPFGRLWYGEPNAVSSAIGYAMHDSRSADAVICVYDAAGNVMETHEQAGRFQRVLKKFRRPSLERKKRMAALQLLAPLGAASLPTEGHASATVKIM
jgi:hypothetical protein